MTNSHSAAWQPIETAPKDGTRILGFAAYIPEVTIVSWKVCEPFGEKKTWTTDSEGPGYSFGFDDGDIVAWMPLPEPPK